MINARNSIRILFASVVCCTWVLATGWMPPVSAKPQSGTSENASEPGGVAAFHSVRMESAPSVADRAWESRPYQVAVWICHQGEPQFASVESRVINQIQTRCELIDPSAWFVTAGTPPPHWRNLLLKHFEDNEGCSGFQSDPELQHYDKLVVVRLIEEDGWIRVSVRENDLQTGQWGPVVDREVSSVARLGSVAGAGVAEAFMPLAKIERVDEADKVHIQARAIDACVRIVSDDQPGFTVQPITGSPVLVKNDDRLLPIIRKTDRSGDLVSLDPIPFTFLTLDSITGSSMIASIHSSQRAPLSQRKSKRAQKLAIVIRPVQRSSTLHLESIPKSSDAKPNPLEGYEVWARKPGDAKDVQSEFLGKTDWQGNVMIPPSDSGLRLLYIKRGARALRKLPVIPGFKDRLVSQLPNDDTRLFAEGVINGYGNDIINLVVQRELLEVDIQAALDADRFDDAKKRMREYQELETPADLKVRMSNEEIRLKSMTTDKREFEFISSMFGNLRQLLNSKVTDSRAIELQQTIQQRVLEKGADG